MDDAWMWLPISLAVILFPATISLWAIAEIIMIKEIQELNKLNGWED